MYQIKTEVDRIEGIFSADLANVDRLMKCLRLFMKKNRLTSESFACELVAREALNNAIVHAFGGDSKKKIRFILEFRPQDIIMKISDEGHGFDWRKCLAKEYDPKSTSGRGVLLLKLYASEFQFNEKGNEILFTFPCHRRGRELSGSKTSEKGKYPG